MLEGLIVIFLGRIGKNFERFFYKNQISSFSKITILIREQFEDKKVFFVNFLFPENLSFWNYIIFMNYYIEKRNCRFCHFLRQEIVVCYVIFIVILNVLAIKGDLLDAEFYSVALNEYRDTFASHKLRYSSK